MLEVGCADGLNLVAMAGNSPGLTAVGFDLVDPALGRQAAADLGLTSVRLEQADLLDAPRLGGVRLRRRARRLRLGAG